MIRNGYTETHQVFATYSSFCVLLHIQTVATFSTFTSRLSLHMHSSLCNTHLSLCYTQACPLLHIQVWLHIHSFATLSTRATLKPLLFRVFVTHTFKLMLHIQSFAACPLKLPPHTLLHIQAFVAYSSLLLSLAAHSSCCYTFSTSATLKPLLYTSKLSLNIQVLATNI